MTPEQFAYWLQGFVELSDTSRFTEHQTQIIKDHLALVFTKVTPERKSSEDMATEIEKILEKRKLGSPSPVPYGPYVNPNPPYVGPNSPAIPPWPTFPTVICSAGSDSKYSASSTSVS